MRHSTSAVPSPACLRLLSSEFQAKDSWKVADPSLSLSALFRPHGALDCSFNVFRWLAHSFAQCLWWEMTNGGLKPGPLKISLGFPHFTLFFHLAPLWPCFYPRTSAADWNYRFMGCKSEEQACQESPKNNWEKQCWNKKKKKKAAPISLFTPNTIACVFAISLSYRWRNCY